MKSGVPRSCDKARSTSRDATFETDATETIFSAPETCRPPLDARIFTEYVSLMEITILRRRAGRRSREVHKRKADAVDGPIIRNKGRH